MNHDRDDNNPIISLNGEFVRLRDAGISPADRGFLFGDGLFETLRADAGHVHYLEDHLARLADSAARIRIELPPPSMLGEAICNLLEMNELRSETARIRITVTRGIHPASGLPHSDNPTMLVTARRYSPPTGEQYEQGWRICTFKGGCSPPLAALKTLNYLFFQWARQSALDAGKDDAVVTGPSGEVAETTTGSLLLHVQGAWRTPSCPLRLEGITLRKAAEKLAIMGQDVTSAPVSVNDLHRARAIWVLNSMIGVMPVCEIDGNPVPMRMIDAAESIRRGLFSDH